MNDLLNPQHDGMDMPRKIGVITPPGAANNPNPDGEPWEAVYNGIPEGRRHMDWWLPSMRDFVDAGIDSIMINRPAGVLNDGEGSPIAAVSGNWWMTTPLYRRRAMLQELGPFVAQNRINLYLFIGINRHVGDRASLDARSGSLNSEDPRYGVYDGPQNLEAWAAFLEQRVVAQQLGARGIIFDNAGGSNLTAAMRLIAAMKTLKQYGAHAPAIGIEPIAGGGSPNARDLAARSWCPSVSTIDYLDKRPAIWRDQPLQKQERRYIWIADNHSGASDWAWAQHMWLRGWGVLASDPDLLVNLTYLDFGRATP